MIIVFSGGLGNQMFQYAFYLAKKKKGVDVYINTYSIRREGLHNGYELERLFGIKSDDESSLWVRIVRKLLIFRRKKRYKTISNILLWAVKIFTSIKIIEEKGYSRFNSEYLKPCQGFVLYFGYWQSPFYFDAFQNEIRNIFSFDKLQLSEKSELLLSTLRQNKSVAVHIRRGDFLPPFDNITCSVAYYQKAISLIKAKIKDPLFVFFSDDLGWVKENIHLSNMVCVDWNQGINSWEDLFLMSQCKHNIIANSTFSWWGAWLNENEEKTVIAPSKFIKHEETPDIYPKDWITIHS
jgi:hypothetical protein